jgi:1-acyl-sn-glycerol-3-phosphate acyltransferase
MQIIAKEKLDSQSPMIFTANHASYIDAVVALAIVPKNTCFVVKKELFSSIFFRSLLKKLDYLPVDRLDFSKGIEDTKHILERLNKGYSIFIFPEGTFGYSSGLRPFRLGAFKIATETKTAICPIAIQGTRSILRADEILMRPNHIAITVCDLVKPHGSEWQDVTELRNAVRAEIAKYCGEPSLDFIAAQTVAPKRT